MNFLIQKGDQMGYPSPHLQRARRPGAVTSRHSPGGRRQGRPDGGRAGRLLLPLLVRQARPANREEVARGRTRLLAA